jgi:formylglycine-generating enzyme
MDPMEPGVMKRVMRGGSYLSSPQYNPGYIVGVRGKGEPSTATSDIGFRCAN